MYKLTLKDIFNEEEGCLYSIQKNDLIPFNKENINSLDNNYLADAKFIVNIVEDMHPYFITELYDFKRYKKAREYFLEKCKETNSIDFKFQMLKYFKVLMDGHMSMLPPDEYELNYFFTYSDNNLYLKDTNIVILKIGGIDCTDLIKKVDEYFFFENLSNKELYISKYLREHIFLKYMGCSISDNTIDILTEIGVDHCEFVKRKQGDVALNTITSSMIDDILYIDYKECRVTNEIYSIVKDIKNSINNQIHKIIIDARFNLGGTAKANKILMDALNLHEPTIGSVVRLSNNIKLRFPDEYKFDDVNEDEIKFSFYKSDLKPASANKDIRLVILTSKNTYSAAMQFALQISDGKLGLVIGEIPSNSPCSFSEMYSTETPRLKIPFRLSYRYFVRPDFAKEKKVLLPEIQVEAEKALDKAINYLKN